MSTNLRERTTEVYEKGVAERGNFEPTGVPLRMYKYWARLAKANDFHVPERENFCHFYRVVLFWAPVFFFFDNLEKSFESNLGRAIWAAGYTLVFAMIGLTTSADIVAMGVLSTTYIFFGILSGFLALQGDRYAGKTLWTTFWITAPISGFIWVIAELASRWPRHWTDPVLKGLLIAVSGATALYALGLLALAVMEFGIWPVVGFALSIIAGAAVGVGFIAGICYLSDYLKGRRRMAEEARINEAFLNGSPIKPLKPIKVKKPSKTKAFFVGVGDMVIFVANVVRVNKWKICPTTTIDIDAD